MRQSNHPAATMAAISLRVRRPFGLLACCLGLAAAVPAFAESPSAVPGPAPAAAVEDKATQKTRHTLEAKLMQSTAEKLEARTRRAADLIVRGQTVRLMEGLTRMNDEKSNVSAEISRRIDVNLAAALTDVRDSATRHAKR